MSWEIEYNSVRKTLAEWGLRSLTRTLVSQGVDEVTAVADGAGYDSDPIFAYGQTAVFFKDGVRWFHGRVMNPERSGTGAAESITYKFAGPWWYLEDLVYQQKWNQKVGIGLEAQYRSRAILGMNLNGTSASSGQVIADVVGYAASVGRPLALGTVDPALNVPWDEMKDATCAEVIKRMLQWTPDCVAWFDYTGTTPVLNIRSYGNLPAASATIPGSVESVNIQPRYDLQRSGVIIKYEKNNDIDGQSFSTLEIDKAPVGASEGQIGVVISTIELGGVSVAYQRQKVKTAYVYLAGDDFCKNWFKKKIPWLKDYENDKLTVTGVEMIASEDIYQLGSEDPEAYEGDDVATLVPRELMEGTFEEWMSTSVKVGHATVKAKISYDGDSFPHFGGFEASVNIMATSAPLGETNYSRMTSFTAAEPTPVGLAGGIYGALSVLHYDGRITLTEEECGGLFSIGKRINLIGGRAEWETMNAMIQQLTEDVDSGTTTLTFGAPTHLGPSDLVELLRALRGRQPTWRLQERTEGNSSSRGGESQGGRYTPKENSSSPTPTKLLALQGGTPWYEAEDGWSGDQRYIIMDSDKDGECLLQMMDDFGNYGQLIIKEEEAGFWFYDELGNNIKFSKGALEMWTNSGHYAKITCDSEGQGESSFWFHDVEDGDNVKFYGGLLQVWNDDGDGYINLDIEDVKNSNCPAGTVINLQEIDVCKAGVKKKALCMISEPYEV